MSENTVGNDLIKSSIQKKIDDLIKTNSELKNYRDDLKRSFEKFYKTNTRIEEVGIKLTKELKELSLTEKIYDLEIKNAIDKVEKKRIEIEKMRNYKDNVEKMRIDYLKIFERKVADTVSKFENAPMIYSNFNLLKLIEDVEKNNVEVNNEIFNVNREIEILISKYGLKDDTIMIIFNKDDESVINDLIKFKEICYDSKTAATTMRKNITKDNEELLKIFERNKKKIINLKK